MDPAIEQVVVEKILAKFDQLPKKYKPAVEQGELHNWVPLSGVAFVDDEGRVEVVAVATGMKCLPSTAITSLSGIALHDCHAEVLALRLFNHFLLTECHKITSTAMTETPYKSAYIQQRSPEERLSEGGSPQPFAVDHKWHIYMYCSEAPCGDASMELIMAKQADATPWAVPAPASQPVETASSSTNEAADSFTLMGRGYFSELGAVRRKPARGDSPPTLSKSCTDKLALKQCTSLLSSLTSLLIDPGTAYLHTLILPTSQMVPEACTRAFGPAGRMASVQARSWEGGYAYRQFEISATNQDFRFSRRASANKSPRAGLDSKPSNVAAAWNPYASEVIIGGILQGKKKGDEKGASVVSRRKTSELCVTVLEALRASGHDEAIDLEHVSTYADVKASFALRQRRAVKEQVLEDALRGWVRNERDDFELCHADRQSNR